MLSKQSIEIQEELFEKNEGFLKNIICAKRLRIRKAQVIGK